MLSIRDYIKGELNSLYSKEEISSITQIILKSKFNISLIDSLNYKLNNLSDLQLNILNEIIEKLKTKEPLQYILGETFFYNMSFTVNRNVLVPRPETEELIEWIIDCERGNNISILDIGTGSGCIAITLAKNILTAKVHAWDISSEALEVAKHNAKRNDVIVDFSQNDILNMDNHNQLFDVIVSNPPYITQSESKMMHQTVLDFEPHIALFVPDSNPLLFYEHISHFAMNHLRKGGSLYYEINQNNGEDTKSLLANMGFVNIELRHDISGNERMIKATKP